MKKIVTLFIVLCFGLISQAQTATIGTGTATNDVFSPSPININSRRNVSQMVYTVAEINAAGVSTAGDINKLGYFVTTIPIFSIPGYTIQMKHTNAGNAGGNLNGGYTTVKNAFTYSPVQGDWDMIDLDTPFPWNGTENIVVRICWSQVQPAANPSGQVRVINSNRGYKYRLDDNTGSICGSNPNTRIDTKPQIRFVFESETTWLGTVSTDWFDNGNWSANAPDKTMDVTIPTGVPNNPNLTALSECNNLILNGTMNVAASGVINIYGNFTNSGTYVDAGGTTVLTGEGPSVLSNAGALTLANLVFESNNGGVITGSEITITEELNVNKTTLNTNGLIILSSTAAGTARISELTTQCAYTLNMQDEWGDGWNGGTLTILEDGVSIGVYQAFAAATSVILDLASGSNIQLQYASGDFENENTYQLLDPSGTQVFADGGDPATGIVFTTTPACAYTETISGEITMERFIDAGETYWRFFSSAVQGATIGDYQDDFTTAGYPGSPFPNFGWVSIYNYDETQGTGLGYIPVSGSGQIMQAGEGFLVWSGDTITGTQPFTVDLKGLANQGDVVMPVSFTSSGDANEDGWNLVGNPYPSTIDWDSDKWQRGDMANAVQILNSQSKQYATYVNGASTLGGSRYIASQQAFWVYANNGSAFLTATEGVKVSNEPTFFRSSTISPGMTMSVNGFNMLDECVIRHIENAESAYEPDYDAYKLYGSYGPYPHISLVNDEAQDLTVHSFDKGNQEWHLPIRVLVYQNGFYDLNFENISELDVPCIKLEDTYTGILYPVVEGESINVELSDTTSLARFILHIGNDYEMNTVGVTCNGSNDGSVQLDLNQASIGYIFENIETENGGGGSGINGSPLVLSGLESGTYNLSIPDLVNTCNNNEFTFVVPTPSAIVVGEIVSNELLGGDGSIVVQVNGGTQPYTYEWSNGENTNTTSNLIEGIYNLTVTDANDCVWEGDFELTSSLGTEDETEKEDELKVTYNSITNEISISGLVLKENENVFVYDANGKLVEQFLLNSGVNSKVHKLRSPLSKGVYFIEVNNLNQKFAY